MFLGLFGHRHPCQECMAVSKDMKQRADGLCLFFKVRYADKGKDILIIPWDLPALQAIYENPYLHSPEKDSFPHGIAALHSSVPFHRILKLKIHLCFFYIPADISLSQQSTHFDSDNFFQCKCNGRGTKSRKKDSKTRQTHSFFWPFR